MLPPRAFVFADPHFGHQGVCEFTNRDGSKLRPFTTAAEMDEAMVDYWNQTVNPHDKTYIIGDIAMHRRSIATIARLHGSKILIKGNHDIHKLKDYMPYFKDIRAYNVINMFLLSHIPIHPDSQAKFRGQIHGHLHSGRVMKDGKIDPWYYCVSAEHIDYRPLLLDEAMNRLLKQKEEAGISGTFPLVPDDMHPG